MATETMTCPDCGRLVGRRIRDGQPYRHDCWRPRCPGPCGGRGEVMPLRPERVDGDRLARVVEMLDLSTADGLYYCRLCVDPRTHWPWIWRPDGA